MQDTQLDRLDQISNQMRGSKKSPGGISTGEFLYVALASNRPDLLKIAGYSVSAALSRLGPDWTTELIARHRCN